jgi:hypothetical protein
MVGRSTTGSTLGGTREANGITEPTKFNKDYTGIRRGPCLGCGERLVTARDPYVMFGGKRDGSLLIAIDTTPHAIQATKPEEMFDAQDLFLLAVAHRGCVDLARGRLEGRQVDLPEQLIAMRVTPDQSPLPQLHLPPDRTVCAWCDAADASDEHVFAEWISKELARCPLMRETDHGPLPITSIDLTAPVCTRCNNRWLSVLEKDAQRILAPMIHRPDTVTLTTEDQRLLATWAVKTAMMLDLASAEPVIPAGFYHAFRQARAPLPGNWVWLGAYLGKRHVDATPYQRPPEATQR